MKSVAQRSAFGTALKTTTRVVPPRVRSTSQIQNHKNETPIDTTLVATSVAVSTTFLASQPVQAAQEYATIAAGDTRLGAVFFLFVPAIAWVLFNITGPASRQFAKMQADKPKPTASKPVARRAPPQKAAPKKVAPKKAAPKKIGFFKR